MVFRDPIGLKRMYTAAEPAGILNLAILDPSATKRASRPKLALEAIEAHDHLRPVPCGAHRTLLVRMLDEWKYAAYRV